MKKKRSTGGSESRRSEGISANQWKEVPKGLWQETPSKGKECKSVTGTIIGAINRPEFKARTINGIIKDTKLPRNVVVNAIKNDPSLSGKIKIYPRRSKDGQVLITTKEKFDKEASIRDKFIDVFATIRTGVEDLG